jgi:hypothetical protein
VDRYPCIFASPGVRSYFRRWIESLVGQISFTAVNGSAPREILTLQRIRRSHCVSVSSQPPRQERTCRHRGDIPPPVLQHVHRFEVTITFALAKPSDGNNHPISRNRLSGRFTVSPYSRRRANRLPISSALNQLIVRPHVYA